MTWATDPGSTFGDGIIKSWRTYKDFDPDFVVGLVLGDEARAYYYEDVAAAGIDGQQLTTEILERELVCILYIASRALANIIELRGGSQVKVPVLVGLGLRLCQRRIATLPACRSRSLRATVLRRDVRGFVFAFRWLALSAHACNSTFLLAT